MSKTFNITQGLDSLTYWIVERRNGYHAIDEYDLSKERCLNTVITHISKKKAVIIADTHNYRTGETFSRLTGE